MSTVSSIVPVMTMTPPDGKLLYINPYTYELSNIDVQGAICSSGVVNDRAYPPMYNARDGILHAHDASDVKTNYISNTTDTSTKPSDLKNTKTNIRKIKPDINSDLKRV